MTRAIGLALLLALSAALTIVVRAPAAWLGDWLEARSKLRLIDARGTLWQGSALLGFSNGRETTLVPGRVEWRIDTFTPRIGCSETHPDRAWASCVSTMNERQSTQHAAARGPVDFARAGHA